MASQVADAVPISGPAANDPIADIEVLSELTLNEAENRGRGADRGSAPHGGEPSRNRKQQVCWLCVMLRHVRSQGNRCLEGRMGPARDAEPSKTLDGQVPTLRKADSRRQFDRSPRRPSVSAGGERHFC